MFKDYVDFKDALACYNFLARKKKKDPEELHRLTSNFRMYAKMRVSLNKDPLAKKWIDTLDGHDVSGDSDNDIGTDKKNAGHSDKPILIKVEKAPDLDAALQPLQAMIGLTKAKAQINDFVGFTKILAARKKAGMATSSISAHMAFLGNPGTGKTTAARHIADILWAMGHVSKNSLVEVDRSDLIGPYIGQTEERTRRLFDSAKGGVLFIDEAHTLLQNDNGWDFGRECTDVLCKLMEDYRDTVVVILAGYKKEMEQTILAHAGIKSRVQHRIEFDDFTPDENLHVFEKFCNDNQYAIEQDTRDKLLAYFKGFNRDGLGASVNGRDVRNIFEKSLLRQARRLSAMKRPSRKHLAALKAEDIDLPTHAQSGGVVYLKN